MIKAILWDIDGTLLDFEYAEKYAIRKCFELHGLGECSDAMLSRYSKINKKYWEALERGEMSKPQILVGRFKEFFETEGLDASVAEGFNRDYQIHLGDPEGVKYMENADKVVNALSTKVFQGIVTNGTKTAQDRKLLASGLSKLIDREYVFISEEVGFEKPNEHFFDPAFTLLNDLGINKDEVIIIGDSLTSDIQGGINVSIKTCWYNPKKKTNNLQIIPDMEISDIIQVLEILE